MGIRYLLTRISILIILLLIVLIFAVQNATLIDIQVFRWQFEVRRSVLIAVALCIGFMLGWHARIVYRIIIGTSSRS